MTLKVIKENCQNLVIRKSFLNKSNVSYNLNKIKNLYITKMISSFLYYKNNHIWKVRVFYLKLIRWS